MPIWTKEIDENILQITLQFPTKTKAEGELLLVVTNKSIVLFTLTFIICSGSLLCLPYNHILFIGGIQGEKNRKEEIRNAAKCNGEIAPATLLVIAAQAIKITFKLDAIVGVTIKEQLTLGKNEDLENNISSYDELWTVFGGTKYHDKFFVLPPHHKETPLVGKNKSRARFRRKLKQLVRSEIVDNLKKLF